MTILRFSAYTLAVALMTIGSLTAVADLGQADTTCATGDTACVCVNWDSDCDDDPDRACAAGVGADRDSVIPLVCKTDDMPG